MNNREKFGISILELLVVISILIFLFAILSPTLSAARRNAQITSSSLRLKQLHQLIELYSIDYDLDRVPNDRPSYAGLYSEIVRSDNQMLVSPRGITPVDKEDIYRISSYAYYVEPLVPQEYFLKYPDTSMLFFDPDCNEPGVFSSPFTTKLALGIRRSGELIRRRCAGDPYELEFWHSECTN